MPQSRRSLYLGAMSVAAFALSGPAQAQKSATGWKPDRSVTLVVPYGAGGGTDATARAVGKRLGEIWGQPVVVENLPGADGLIGTRKVIDAKPDGYTLLLQVPAITLTKHQPGMKGIDPLSQLEAITSLAQSPSTFVVNSKLPVKTFAEFVQYCTTAAQPCSMATGESIGRLLTRKLSAETGLPNLIIVNYKGSGPMVADLLSNTVNAAFTGINAVLPHHKSGTLRIVSTLSPKRAPQIPEVPSLVEAGFPDYRAVTWYGLFAPKGTPTALRSAVAAAVAQAVQDDAVKKTLAFGGAESVGNTPAEFATEIRQDAERLDAMVKKFSLE